MITPTNRRGFLQAGAASVAWLQWNRNARGSVDDDSKVPETASELWADFDPRKDPLETETIREWNEPGVVYRLVRFLIGTFKGQPARMTAIYGFPESGGSGAALPAVMHIHGGGQRAFLHEVKFLAKRGYAALSVNWGGSGDGKPPFNSADGARVDDPNTDWGAVDPSQLNSKWYASILPGPKQLFEDREHPKNCNWYLLTLACRRGLTFLERQAEVDPERLGVHGFSMGGNLTMYVAGSDDRVKAAAPGVGGAGWRWQRHEFLGGGAQQDHVQGDVDRFRRTLSFESYAPLIRCPVLHRSGTNDFHGWMDDVYRTNALIPDQPTRFSWSPHLNHRFSPEVEVAMPLWFDQHLKSGPVIPETPSTELMLSTEDHVPRLRVGPLRTWPVQRCEVFYSIDPDPRARFWRSADVVPDGDSFIAKLPVHSLDFPLFAFANVHFTLPEPVALDALPGRPATVNELCLSSLLHSVSRDELRSTHVAATAKPSRLINDFSHGMRDWYQFNANNPTHAQTWTRKLVDPMWRGESGAKLTLTLTMPKTNRLTFVVQNNEWRSYRGPRATFLCELEISGAEAAQTVPLSAAQFRSSDGQGKTLESWSEVEQFGVCAHFTERGAAKTPAAWNGPAMTLARLEWT